MAKVTPISEHFQHFVRELQDSFWGDLESRTQQAAQRLFDALSERQRDLYMVSSRYSRSGERKDYRNGYYERDFVTKFGTLRLRVARTRKKGFLPAVVNKFQRWFCRIPLARRCRRIDFRARPVQSSQQSLRG
jgi:putative transposase